VDERVVRVWATAAAIEGELLRGRLEAEGISVMLKGEGEGPYRTGPVELWVPAEHEAAARAVIEAVRAGTFEVEAFAEVEGPAEEVPAEEQPPG
jgi:putative signal transducing protein